MKSNIFTSTAAVLLIAVAVSSCASSKSSTKKSPEGNPGPTTSTKSLPPGQAKKIYGEKSAKVFAPGQQKKKAKYYPLIIVRTPGIIILKHTDGRYYYKNEDSYIYWLGSDDRFYLDEQHLEKVDYDKNELENWKSKGKPEKKTPPGQAKKEEDKQHGKGNENKKSKKN